MGGWSTVRGRLATVGASGDSPGANGVSREYRRTRRLRAPRKTVVIPMGEDSKTYTFRCTVCGWEVTVDTPELPEDFVCELCGVGPDMFELVEE